jgi:hypothetical protein
MDRADGADGDVPRSVIGASTRHGRTWWPTAWAAGAMHGGTPVDRFLIAAP